MTPLFLDKSTKPDDRALEAVLGRSFIYWKEIKNTLAGEYGTLTEEWKYYGVKSGWTLKLLLKKRNLFFFAPHEKYFLIAFVFGDKAVKAVEQIDLPVRMIRELSGARRYAEGRGLRLEVKRKADIKTIIRLVAIKVGS